MANIWEKAKSIRAGNLNSGLSYVITTVSLATFRKLAFYYIFLPSKRSYRNGFIECLQALY